MASCQHSSQAREVTPSGQGCKECLEIGSTWVHLRLCMVCGHVGCCDNSPNKHGTKHWHRSKHPVMKSFEPGEEWWWCYQDDTEIDPVFPDRPEWHYA
jgi:uncharacterized UBP type Zn finger protein